MKVETFKGKPILVLPGEGEREVRLGITKAKTVLVPENLTALRRFVAEYDRPAVQTKPEPAPAPTVDLAKELADLRAQLAELKKPETAVATTKEKPAGRFAGK